MCACFLVAFGVFLMYAGWAVESGLAEWGQSTGIAGLRFVAPVVGVALYCGLVVGVPAVIGGLFGWAIQRVRKSVGGTS
jgi:hypothetical protein